MNWWVLINTDRLWPGSATLSEFWLNLFVIHKFNYINLTEIFQWWWRSGFSIPIQTKYKGGKTPEKHFYLHSMRGCNGLIVSSWIAVDDSCTGVTALVTRHNITSMMLRWRILCEMSLWTSYCWRLTTHTLSPTRWVSAHSILMTLIWY